MGHLKDEKNAWCKMCADGEVEDAGHYMCRCPNDLYGKVRTAWYLKVKEKLKGMRRICLRLIFHSGTDHGFGCDLGAID